MSKRERTRKKPYAIRLRKFILGILSTAVIISIAVFSVIMFFKITDIKVSGETRYSLDSIRASMGIELGTNMYAINKFEIIDKLKNEYPYINDVKIRRRLPGTINVEVKDSVPYAAIEEDGQYWIINEDGRILQQANDDFFNTKSLVKIKGIELLNPKICMEVDILDENKQKTLFNILHILEFNDILISVNEIDITKSYQITMIYDGRFTVCLGDYEQIERKIKFFIEVEKNLVENDRGIVDVSEIKKARFIPET